MLAGSWGHGMSRKSLFSPVIAHPATMKFAWEARAENNKSIGAVQTWHWFQVAPLTQAYVPPPNVKPTPTWSKWLWHVVAPVSTALPPCPPGSVESLGSVDPYGWGNSQAEVRQRLLKAWAQPSCEALGQSMVKFQWNGLCGGFPYPSSLTEDFTWPLIHCKKTQLSNYTQVKTFVMATDQELTPTIRVLPCNSGYRYQREHPMSWHVMTIYRRILECQGQWKSVVFPYIVALFSFLNQLLLKFSCRRLAGTQHCAVNFSLWA